MEIGIGLPNAVRGTGGAQIVEWARRSEATGFSSLGTIDRIAYPNYESLIALAAAGAVTERIRLLTSILLGPVRSTPLLAKQAASVDSISNGRLVLGLAPGGRPDDYTLAGVPFERRGALFDEQLEELEQLFSGAERGDGYPVIPEPAREGGPEIVIGGGSTPAFRRAARYAIGWMQGGGGPDAYAEALPKLSEAWAAAGRDGEPRRMALAYFALGDDAEEQAQRSLGDYYAWLGEYTDMIVQSTLTTPEAIGEVVAAYDGHGCDELVLFPANPDPAQVELLREAL